MPNMQSKFFYIFTFLFIFFVVSWILFYLCWRCVIVDIGGCNLKFFSLGDSMALDHKVCTFVVNCICRKFFLDERPTISLKHYFFSCVSVSILILLFFWKLNNWSILFIIFFVPPGCIHERLWWLFIHRKVLQWSCFCAPIASVWTGNFYLLK